MSGVYEIYPMINAEPIEVYCELDIAGGGFSFLSHSLTLRSDAQQLVNALFKDKKTVLLNLQNKDDGSESYTLIQPHPNYASTNFGILVNSYYGYTQPKNYFMEDYIFFGILPASVARNSNTQGFKSNGDVIQFKNCDATPNSLFAFMPNRNYETPSGFAAYSHCEDIGVAVDWRSKAKPITLLDRTMPNKFFFLTELSFGGCGCYTSSDRWRKFGYNASAIGIR